MKTKTIQYLTILLILSIISCQSLLDNVKNATNAVVNSTVNALPSTVSALIPSGVPTPSSAAAVLDGFKNGPIKNILPSNLGDLNKFINGLAADNFGLGGETLIPNLDELQVKSSCVKRLNRIFKFMSMAEQVAFFSAFQSATANVTVNTTNTDSGRCFLPKILHQAFKTVNTGNVKAMSKKMSEDSQSVKKSFSCISDSFKQLKLKTSFKEEVEEFFNTQATSNQCKGSFMKSFTAILGLRRRYFLLREKELNETAVSDATGNVVGFTWLESEVEEITKLFLTFAECYQGLPESITKVYSSILSRVSEDPVCSGTRRFLQTAQPATSPAQPTQPATSPAQPTQPATSPAQPATSPAQPATSPVQPSGSTAQPSGSQPRPSGSGKKPDLGDVFLGDNVDVKNIVMNLNKKDGDYLKVGAMVNGLLTASVKSKCNLAQSFNGLLLEKNDNLQKLVRNEIKKFDKKEDCKGDYMVYINKPKGVSQGNVNCTNADALCTNSALNFKTNFANNGYTVVSTCVSSTRFLFGYFEEAKAGNFVDVNLYAFQSCKKGSSSNCAKELASMKAGGNCVPAMKKDCNDVITKNCQASNLFKSIESLTPSATASPLPKECQNIDPVTPNYTPCFTWINKNLIAFTLFPHVKNIDALQSLINQSQAATLRYLQDATIKIVKSDASSTDTVAQLPASEVQVSDSEIAIDGTTPTSISVSATTVSQIEPEASTTTPTPASGNAGNFNKFGYLLISFLIAMLI